VTHSQERNRPWQSVPNNNRVSAGTLLSNRVERERQHADGRLRRGDDADRVPGWVGPSRWIVGHVRIVVVALRARRVRLYAVRRQEAALR
jgi:hypothetical protein